MATDIEKATALIGVNAGRYPTGTDQNVLDGYTRDIAQVHRSLYKLDDATAITQAWLFSVGGTNANPSIFTIGAGLTLSINTSGATAIVATNPASTALPTTATRGAVRRLVAPLGITLTGVDA